MIDFFLPYVDILFFAGILSTLLGIFIWRRRHISGNYALALTIFSVMIWTLAGAFEGSAISETTKILLSKIQYIGIVNLPPFFLLFVLIYTGRVKNPYQIKIGLLWLLPVFFLISAWTNQWHHLFWQSFSEIDPVTRVMTYNHGPIFWGITAYSYIVILIILIILIGEFRKASHAKYRWQIVMMVFAAIFPMAGGIVYVTNLNPIPGMDWTPVGGFLSVLVLTISVISFHFMDLVPVAKEILLEQMDIGMLVVDPKMRIVDLNKALQQLMNNHEIKIGNRADEFFSNLGIEIDIFENLDDPVIFELEEPEDGNKFIEVKLNLLKTENRVLGWLAIFRDISEQKLASMAIESINLNLQSKLEEIQKLQKTLEEQAIHDPLTNVYNRRFFDESFEKELARSKRSGKPLCIIMIDIDHFKRINDQFGHAVGDQVLRNFGELLIKKTRKSDVICRYGGEEFIILFIEADEVCLMDRADEIRKDFRKMCLDDPDLQKDVTISIGVACYPKHGEDTRELILKADRALYDAKENGRNQVYLAR